MYMFLFLHLLITSDLLFSMLLSSCRAIASFSSRNRRHHLELWLYVLWVPKISQDRFEVLFADMIVQYSYDSSVSVWYLMLLNFFMVRVSKFECCFTKDVLLNRIEHEYLCCDTSLVINGCF